MSRIVIVRHGDTFAPDEPPRRIGARTDIPLVDSGRRQAVILRRWFDRNGLTFERAYASPLARARQTADILLAGSILEVELAHWLSEIDHGPDEDRPETDVVRRLGAAALAAWDRQAIGPPGWVIDAPARIAGWHSLLADRASHTGAVLVVTSSGAARFALLATAGLRGDAAALPSLKLRTGAFGRLDLVGGCWRVGAWDRRPSPACMKAAAER